MTWRLPHRLCVSMLHFDGPNASTTFLDESGKAWTAFGNVQISTAQSVFGGASCLFDGTGDYLRTPASTDFAFGTGDFTISCRVRTDTVTGDHFIFSSATNGEFFYGIHGANIGIGRVGIAWDKQVAHGMSTGVWYHLMVSRTGGYTRFFKDGTLLGSAIADTTNWAFANLAYLGSQGASLYFDGYIDEFRIDKGVARATADFVVPAHAYQPAGVIAHIS